MLVLPDRIFESHSDAVIACQNLVSVSFGAAAITLNRTREEVGLPLPDPITTQRDQWIGLVYQIRNAFAHDISEPRWEIQKATYRCHYHVGSVNADLTELHGRHFQYADIGGAEALFTLRGYANELFFSHRMTDGVK